jgi:hypothetical protein
MFPRLLAFRPFPTRVLVAFFLLVTVAFPVGAKTPACSFTPPKDWTTSETRWHGACVKGRADGVGILRHVSNGKVDRVFYGKLSAGVPSLGVIEINDGYIAGRFVDGEVVRNDDRNALIRAFAEAEKAAKAAANRFAREGNEASAKHYRERAKALANQLD